MTEPKHPSELETRMTEKKYTASEAAAIIGITPDAIVRAIRENRLPAEHVRDRTPWQISERAIRNFMEREKR